MKMTEKMPPPPRKVKPTVALKNIHSEQVSKLEKKHQQECDLLDDIRTFSQKRSIIEKEYAQSLLKLTSQLLKREFASLPELVNEEGKDYKTANTVWRSILEETERVAKARLQAAETYLEKVHEPVKNLKAAKAQTLKKVMDQLAIIQTEISGSVREMAKTHKVYCVDESLSHDARQKASEADDRLQKKSTGLFQSVASLQRTSAKLNSRFETCEVKSTSSRNDYLLSQSAANAHQIRYCSTDLPELMRALDGDMYESVQEYLTIVGCTAVECSSIEQECFSKVLSQAGMVSRDYNLQCFLHQNHVFTNLPQYQFDACHGDRVTKVSRDHDAEHNLDKEARKWATKIAKESKAIRDYTRMLKALLAGEVKVESPTESRDSIKEGKEEKKETNNQDPEQRMEECRQIIRKAETGMMKAEARIEALRQGGVNVDDWLNSTHIDSLTIDDEEMARTPSQVSLRTESSGGHSEEPENTYHNFEDDDDFIDDRFEMSNNISGVGKHSGREYPVKCTALYDFQASNCDELNIHAHDPLELIADGDGDGWIKARSSSGTTGYIPEDYIQLTDDNVSPKTNDSFSMQDNTSVPSTDEFSPPYNSIEHAQEVSSYSSGDLEIQQSVDEAYVSNQDLAQGIWCRALYDYDAVTSEELSFPEGGLVKIIRKDENGIDDGWWEGEYNGKVGVFPSLVVDELTSTDTTLTEDTLTPVLGMPPDFVPPPPVTVTLPTPDEIDQPSSQIPYESTTDPDDELELKDESSDEEKDTNNQYYNPYYDQNWNSWESTTTTSATLSSDKPGVIINLNHGEESAV